MKQKLKISVSKHPQPNSVMSCKEITIREKILRLLFGEKEQILIMIPGNNVSEVVISKED